MAKRSGNYSGRNLVVGLFSLALFLRYLSGKGLGAFADLLLG